MSSVVNKSSTRFAPKVANRGPGRGPPRRSLSSLRASFSVPNQESGGSDGRPQLDPKAILPESAIDDTEEPTPPVLATPPATLPAAEAADMPAPPPPRSPPPTTPRVAAAPPPVRLSTISVPTTRQRRLLTTASAVAPLVLPVSAPTPPASQQAVAPAAEPATQTDAVVAKPTPKKDEKGRVIIEPERLLRGTRGFTPKEVEDLKNSAINIQTFTMATLCQDIPIGETNDDFEEFESARMQRKRKRARILKAKQMLRGQYQPKSADIRAELLAVYHEHREEREERFGKPKETAQERLRALDAAAPVEHQSFQLQKSENGQISVSTESQVLDRHSNNRSDAQSVVTREIDKFTTVINSYSFSTKERQERWTESETDQFFHALSVWGTDFNLIAHMFPHRSRHQIKTKYKYEERRNPAKVQLFLVHRLRVDMDDYARVSGKDIIEVKQLEEDLERVREEHQEQLKKRAENESKAKAEDAQRQLAAAANAPRFRGIKRERRD